MRIMVIPICPAGGGKTTLYERVFKSKGFNRASADKIRWSKEFLDYKNTGIDYDPEIEPQVWKTFYIKLREQLKTGVNIYIDNTNLTWELRGKLLTLCFEYNYQPLFIWFKTSLEKCCVQNSMRKRVLDRTVIETQFIKRQGLTESEKKGAFGFFEYSTN